MLELVSSSLASHSWNVVRSPESGMGKGDEGRIGVNVGVCELA